MIQAYMPLDMVHKSVYYPYYEKIPVAHKRRALQKIGIEFISKFMRKARITKIQFEVLKNFVADDPNVSNNSIGKDAPFDKDQLIKYNTALLKMINNPDFIKHSYCYRDKLVMEQMRIQKRINNH